MTKVDFKRDKYKQARGGYSRMIDIYCRKCENLVAVYQKDGPGNLRRLYMDRIFSPNDLVDLQKQELKEIPVLKCSRCGEILGMPFIYQKEKRKAFRLYVDAVSKKLRKNYE